jgi:hypothetical protein
MSPDQIKVGKTYKCSQDDSFEFTVLEIKDGAAEETLVRYKREQASGFRSMAYHWIPLTVFARWAKIVVDEKELS